MTEAPPRARRAGLGKRAVIIYLAAVMGVFGLMSLMSSSMVMPSFFFGLAVFLLYVGLTGWGLAGRDAAAHSSPVRGAAVIFLCLFGGSFVWGGVSAFLRTLKLRGDVGSDYIVEASLVGFGVLVIAVGLSRGRRSGR